MGGTGPRWTTERAWGWHAAQPGGWVAATPAPAANQLEMWQGDSFDAETIDRELALAAEVALM
ncbi:MAG: hypothetical protein ACK5SX_08425 [Sandaracinobacter sp.]